MCAVRCLFVLLFFGLFVPRTTILMYPERLWVLNVTHRLVVHPPLALLFVSYPKWPSLIKPELNRLEFNGKMLGCSSCSSATCPHVSWTNMLVYKAITTWIQIGSWSISSNLNPMSSPNGPMLARLRFGTHQCWVPSRPVPLQTPEV